MEKKHENKKLYLEIIRVIAIFLVIFNHSDAFKLPLQSVSCSLLNTAELLLSMCDKVAVPLFFMISGALLLAKEESIQTLYRKRVLRYVIVIILIQIIQHLYAHFAFGVTLSQRMFIHNCIMGWTAPLPKGTANLTIWFLYAYLAFLVLLPFLRVMVKHMKNELFIYLFILQIATCAFLPYKETQYTKYLFLCNTVYLYPLAGYFAEHRIQIQDFNKKWILRSCIAGVLSLAISLGMYRVGKLVAYGAFEHQWLLCFTGGLLIPCITIFLLAKKIFTRDINSFITKIICALGSAVFFIMLFENILRVFARAVITQQMPQLTSIYLRDFSVSLLACAVGFTLGIILKKLPIIKDIL